MNPHKPEAPVHFQATACLDVYVADDCRACDESRRLAGIVAERYPTIRVRIVNLSEPKSDLPEAVVAVPTFVLDDGVLHLGNPREDWLLKELEQATSTN